MSVSPDRLASPALDPEFVKGAFKGVFSDPKQRDLLERVRYTLEHRAQFPYLAESRRRGLPDALRTALAVYSFEGKRTPAEHERLPLDRNFRRRLYRAANSLANDPDGFTPYIRLAIVNNGMKPLEITPEKLRGDFIQALTEYSRDPRSGTSPDPW